MGNLFAHAESFKKPKPAIPVNTMKSAHFREIIGDRVRISIGKRMTKKGAFLAVFF